MRKYPILRPRLYAEEVNKLIQRVATNYEPIDLHAESRRIFGCSGVTADTMLSDLAQMQLHADAPVATSRSGAPG